MSEQCGPVTPNGGRYGWRLEVMCVQYAVAAWVLGVLLGMRVF